MTRRSLWLIVALVLLAFLLRVYRLDHMSLRGDESFTVIYSGKPLAELWAVIRDIEPNPPLYYFALRGAMVLFGQADFATRFLSALFGVLAVPLIYQLARILIRERRTGEMVGLLAALMLAINPYQIWHGQDVRNYTVWPTLSLASLWFMLRALKENRRSLWLGYVVTALASLYTHYYDVFIILFENIYVFGVHWKDRRLLMRWILAQAVLAMLYLPYPLIISARVSTYQDATGAVPGLLGIIQQSLSAFAFGETLPGTFAAYLVPFLLLLLALGLVFAFRLDRKAFAFLLLYAAVPILCLFLFTLWRPFFRVRYLIVMAPALYLGFAMGLAALTRLRWARIVAVAAGLAVLLIPAVFSLGNYYFDPAYAKAADYRGLAAYLEAEAGPDDVIIENYPDPTLSHYYSGPSQRLVLPHRSAVDAVGDLPVKKKATGKALQELLEQKRYLWLIPYQSGWDPQGFVEGWLNRRARRVREEQVDVFRVVVYEQIETVLPAIQHSMTSYLGEEIEFLGYDVRTEGGCSLDDLGDEGRQLSVTDPGSCTMHFTLHWQVLDLVDADYTVFTHVVDTGGAVLTQQDNKPQSGQFPTLEWFPGDVIADEYTLTFPVDTPLGEYTMEVGMYQLETADRLVAHDADETPWPDDAIRLNIPIVVVP
ncbi:MAG TPA: glycosyltransferase family 39 protein [Anaerolineae bacterium]|nr:glycosyltransferase family 39 protein [Anaerolineae bacterium]